MARCKDCWNDAEEGRETCNVCTPAVTCGYCGEGFFLNRIAPSTCPRCHKEWIGVT